MEQFKVLGAKRHQLYERIAIAAQQQPHQDRSPLTTLFLQELDDLAKELRLVAQDPHAGRTTAREAREASLQVAEKRALMIAVLEQQSVASTCLRSMLFPDIAYLYREEQR